jgi:hypothetical protein
MTGSADATVGGKLKAPAFSEGAGGSRRSSISSPAGVAAATGSDDHVSEMMGRLRLTAAESAAVVIDDGGDEIPLYSEWAILGKVLSPTTLHINTIASALRPAWGNPRGLVLNSAGDNRFVAEFGMKADKDRVMNGPPWVVGFHKPHEMVFNSLKV